MSALGHKQTYAPQQTMSALHPIATAKADMAIAACLLYPKERTCAVQLEMSALGQKRTSGRLRPIRQQRGSARQNYPDFGELARLRINFD